MLRHLYCFISDTPFSIPDVTDLLESNTRAALAGARQDERRHGDCNDGANKVVILVVVLFEAVMQYGSLWKCNILDHFL